MGVEGSWGRGREGCGGEGRGGEREVGGGGGGGRRSGEWRVRGVKGSIRRMRGGKRSGRKTIIDNILS